MVGGQVPSEFEELAHIMEMLIMVLRKWQCWGVFYLRFSLL